MSSTAQPSSNLPPAPWKKSFLTQLSLMPSPEFVLSTLEKAPEGSPTPYVPRARFCIFRGMWAEVPPNKHYEGPKNPRVYESELPTFTSDVRMEKVGQLFGSSAGHATKDEQTKGSGGGGPVEAVFWVNVQGKDEEGEGEGKKVMTQWRIKGEAFVVDGNDIEGTETSGVRTVKSEVGKRMRVVDSGKEGEWSWKREVTNHFGNMSPGMRGSFKAPPPGQPKDQPYNDKEEKLGEKVTGLEDPVATKNFRVVIIKPDEVESTDLSDPTKSYRLRHTFNTQTGEWTTTETWP